MKTSSAQLKLMARRCLLGNYGMAVGAELLIFAIMMVIMVAIEILVFIGTLFFAMFSVAIQSMSLFTVGYVVILLGVFLMTYTVEMLFMYGFIRMLLNMCTNQKVQIKDLFFAFQNHKRKFWGSSVALALIMGVLMAPIFVLAVGASVTEFYGFFIIFTIIYSVLLMVLSLVVWLNYGLFFFILVENPEKGILQSLKESRQLMRGNRGRYFYLFLSFIGWVILGYLSLGIGFLWLYPFILCATIFFYLDLKPKAEVYSPAWQTNPEGWQMQQEMQQEMRPVEQVVYAETAAMAVAAVVPVAAVPDAVVPPEVMAEAAVPDAEAFRAAPESESPETVNPVEPGDLV